MPEKDISSLNQKNRTFAASMGVIYCIKPFCTGTDRHNRILMSFRLVTEAMINQNDIDNVFVTFLKKGTAYYCFHCCFQEVQLRCNLEAHPKPSKTSKMEFYIKIVSDIKLSIIFAKSFIFDVLRSPGHVSVI